jgi:very-short-patch-repair endonuclease
LRIPEARRARALRSEQGEAERRLWRRLRNRALGGRKFVRQPPIGPYFADFACREVGLVIEIDGATHSTTEELRHDQAREDFLVACGWRVVRFSNDDVYRNLDGVLETILAAVEHSATRSAHSVPSPRSRGEG